MIEDPFIPLLGVLWLVIALVGAHGLAYGLTRWSIGAGHRWGAVSQVSSRSSHSRPTSRLGGVGLMGGFFVAGSLLVAGLWLLPHSTVGWGANLELLGWLLLGAVAMFCVGLADDLWTLAPPVKLAGQALAASVLPAAGLRFLALEVYLPGVSPTLVSTLAAIGWVVFFVNAFNFMDGMDGFAVRFAMSVCWWLSVAVLARTIINQNIFNLRAEFFLIPILGAACGGFYRLNRPPAKVFMGDAGSLALGFALAVQVPLADGGFYFAVGAVPLPGADVPAMAVWILLWPFVFDVTVTLIRRARLGENLLKPHRSHLYQRLMISGMNHREVLRHNMKYFQLCGVLAVAYTVAASYPVRTGLVAAAVGLMIHYWTGVLKRETEGSAQAHDPAPGTSEVDSS